MRRMKVVGLAAVVVLAFSAIATSNAFAVKEFVSSKTGKLTGKALNTQEFKTGTGATLECTTAAPEGELTKLKGTELATTIKYSGCTVSGIGTAVVSPALYTFFIPLEMSILNKPIIILAKSLGVECETEISAGQRLVTGHSDSELNYVNKGAGIEIVMALTKMAAEIKKSNSTSLCGTAGEKKEYDYKGSIQLEVEGGTLEVK